MPDFTSTKSVAVRLFGDAGQYDNLKMPGGGKVRDFDVDTLRRKLAPFVEGAGSMGKDVLCQHWAAQLKEVHDAAGDAATDAFVQSKKES